MSGVILLLFSTLSYIHNSLGYTNRGILEGEWEKGGWRRIYRFKSLPALNTFIAICIVWIFVKLWKFCRSYSEKVCLYLTRDFFAETPHLPDFGYFRLSLLLLFIYLFPMLNIYFIKKDHNFTTANFTRSYLCFQ